MTRSAQIPTDDAPTDDRPPGAVPPACPPRTAPRDSVPFLWLCLQRPLAGLELLVCVAQVWVLHAVHVVRCRLAARFGRGGRFASDDGMTTAEYAVGTVAACGFAALRAPRTTLLP